MKYHNKHFYERKNTNMISKMYVSNMILNLWVSLLKLWDGKGEVEVKENIVMIIFLVFIAFILNLNYRKKKKNQKKSGTVFYKSA